MRNNVQRILKTTYVSGCITLGTLVSSQCLVQSGVYVTDRCAPGLVSEDFSRPNSTGLLLEGIIGYSFLTAGVRGGRKMIRERKNGI